MVKTHIQSNQNVRSELRYMIRNNMSYTAAQRFTAGSGNTTMYRYARLWKMSAFRYSEQYTIREYARYRQHCQRIGRAINAIQG